MTWKAIAETLNVSEQSVYRVLR
ncbi:hypothetical protein [Rubellimicrobium mesophilum]